MAKLRNLVHYRGAVRGRARIELEASGADNREVDVPTGDRAELYRPSFGMAPVIEVGK